REELEDPAVYVAPGGGARAAALGVELDAAKRALDRAFEAWEAATRALEAAG
ncbi:MAG: hypothetical protein H0W29_12820, partial [Gemmatimonadales bacterium]|nr:hypothetical protein [Gemmatimonadales bacterium]